MVRTIVKADKQILSLQIPEDYIGKQVEIIAFAIDEPIKDPIKPLKRTFTTIKTKVYNFNFNRDELNER